MCENHGMPPKEFWAGAALMGFGFAAPVFFGLSWGYAGWIFGNGDIQSIEFSRLPVEAAPFRSQYQKSPCQAGTLLRISRLLLSTSDYLRPR
jgi:hypothetical protein